MNTALDSGITEDGVYPQGFWERSSIGELVGNKASVLESMNVSTNFPFISRLMYVIICEVIVDVIR